MLGIATRLNTARNGMPPEVLESRGVGAKRKRGVPILAQSFQVQTAERNTRMATHFRFNLARLRACQSLNMVSGSNAHPAARIHASRVIESRPLRRFRARYTPFSLPTLATMHSTARLTVAGNGMPSKVATSGRIGEHARRPLPLPRRSSMDRTSAS